MIETKAVPVLEQLDAFKAIVGAPYVFVDDEVLHAYAHDETEDLHHLPDVVLKPRTAAEISAILKICNQHKIPVTPRGAGTGLSGGALPHLGGVLLSIERLNTILSIDERNQQVTTEAGVITEVLQNAVKERGLFYPPDPSSRGSCMIGGNIAENSGGPKAVKYGVVKDYVLNLEVVLPTGEVIWTGANVLKNATGYNLTQLMVGSEGTLGIVTKIVLKLLPHPKHDLLMLVPFASAEKACAAVSAIFMSGYTPSALEFMERDALEWTMQYVDNTAVPIADDVQAHLLIEVDGTDRDVLLNEIEGIAEVAARFDPGDILFADDAQQKEQLWKLRRRVGEAVKSHSVYKEEDTVVPRAELPVLLHGVKEIGQKYGFKSVCYGHAGDGNLHVNIIKGTLSDADWNGSLKQGITEIFQLVKKLGGTVRGIITKQLGDWEVGHDALSELIVVESMHERKRLMYERCDAVVILPGGFGTLDELFEILTWNALSLHHKKVFLLNAGGFYRHLLQHLQLLADEGFLYTGLADQLTVLASAEDFKTHIQTF